MLPGGRKAAEGDRVADAKSRGGGGVGKIAGEPVVAVGVGEADPFAAFDAVEIAAVQDAKSGGADRELKPGHAFDAGGGEVGGLGVDEEIAVDGGDLDHAGVETAAVGMRADDGWLGLRGNGDVDKRCARCRVGNGMAAMFEPGFERAESGEAFGLVHVDVTVPGHPEKQRHVAADTRHIGGGVMRRAVDLAAVGQKDQRDAWLEGEAAEPGVGLAELEGGTDRDGAVIMGGLERFALGDVGDDQPAHGVAGEDDAERSSVGGGDMVAQGIEVIDRIGHDEAVAPVARGRDHPAFIEQRAIGALVREQLGGQRAFLRTESGGKQQEAAVPALGPGDGKLRGAQFTDLHARRVAQQGRAECDEDCGGGWAQPVWHGKRFSGFRGAVESCSSFGMTFQALAKPSVLTQPVYEPGKPIEYVARELGLDPEGIIKLASNENPFGPSPKALAAARAALEKSELYPDGGCFELRQRLAQVRGMAPDEVVVGNGSNEIIELLGHAFLGPGDEVVMGAPAFVVYKLVTLLFGATAIEVPLRDWRHDLPAMAAAITPRTKLVFVCTPNNPTGTANTEAEVVAFVRGLPEHVICVVDEAYADYLDRAPDLRPLMREGLKVVCLRTFSKIFGLASLRIGYGYGSAEVCALLNRVRQPFNVNAIAQAAAMAALDDVEFAERCVRENRDGLAQLEAGCASMGLECVRSVANFMLVKVGDGARCFDALQRRGMIVRPVKSYGLPEWVRVTVGTQKQNEKFLSELRAWRG